MKKITLSKKLLFLPLALMILAQANGQCIDFFDIHASYVTATYGTFGDPFAQTGVIDFGSDSDQSRLTIHRDLNEYDIYTGLKVIPEGETKVIRLGNSVGGSEAETITYEFTVDASHPYLLFKYANIKENPDHSELVNPFFGISILKEDVILSEVCGIKELNSKISEIYGYGIIWNDWTSFPIDLRPLIGEKIQVQLVNKDCALMLHFGYTYFTLKCFPEFISPVNEDDDFYYFEAPEGFDTFQWLDKDHNIISSDKEFAKDKNDFNDYWCQVFFENEDCELTLSLSTNRVYSVDFDHTIHIEDCEIKVDFHNQTAINTVDGKSIPLEELSFEWDFGNGSYSGDIHPESILYEDAGNYEITLSIKSDTDELIEHITIEITLPEISPIEETLKINLCEGQGFSYKGNEYRETSKIPFEYKTRYGCDSIFYLDIEVHPKVITYDTLEVFSEEEFPIERYNKTFTEETEEGNFIFNLYGPNSCDIIQLHFKKSYHTNSCKEISYQNIMIYPNPATDLIYIENAVDSKVRIIDTAGKIVMEQNIQNEKENIEIYHLQKGMYFMEITGKEGKTVNKIIKK